MHGFLDNSCASTYKKLVVDGMNDALDLAQAGFDTPHGIPGAGIVDVAAGASYGWTNCVEMDEPRRNRYKEHLCVPLPKNPSLEISRENIQILHVKAGIRTHDMNRNPISPPLSPVPTRPSLLLSTVDHGASPAPNSV